MLPTLVKKLKDRVETLYHTKKNKDYQISYSYVSSRIRKKTSKLIDNSQSGLIDEVDKKDLTYILEINDNFKEFAAEKNGYSATRHQREVGVSYFDCVSNTITKGQSSTTAMQESTEKDQF